MNQKKEQRGERALSDPDGDDCEYRSQSDASSEPVENYRVILKLAFELDINEPWTDRVEVLKTRCAALRIPYDSGVVGAALTSAEYQHRHPGVQPRRRSWHRSTRAGSAANVHGIPVQ